MGVSVDISQVTNGLYKFKIFTKQRIKSYLQEQGDELVDYMKNTAPWKDRTGNARRGLGAETIDSSNIIGLSLYHTVDYGIYLEYAMELRFAILEPTVRLKGPDVIKGMQGILNRGML